MLSKAVAYKSFKGIVWILALVGSLISFSACGGDEVKFHVEEINIEEVIKVIDTTSNTVKFQSSYIYTNENRPHPKPLFLGISKRESDLRKIIELYKKDPYWTSTEQSGSASGLGEMYSYFDFDSKEPTFSIRNLDPNTTYYYTIMEFNDAGLTVRTFTIKSFTTK